jgi:hypothetical protein
VYNYRLQAKPSVSSQHANADYPAAFEAAALDWFERLQGLYPALALEVQRLAFEFVRLRHAEIANKFRDKLLKIEILPPASICDLFSGKIERREVSGE